MVSKRTTRIFNPATLLAKTLATLQSLHKGVLSKELTPVEELVCAVLREGGLSETAAQEATARLRARYTDWNEVRVERAADLARLIGPAEGEEELARRLRGMLGRLFDRCGQVSLAFLRKLKTNEARRMVLEIEPVERAVADRILLQEIRGTNLPFSPEAVKLARKLRIIPKSGTRLHLSKLVGEALTHEEAVAFFTLLQRHLESGCAKSRCPLCKN
ncbi:MAG: hypothetical protein V1918_09180 [Planctomycetota bacterium]